MPSLIEDFTKLQPLHIRNFLGVLLSVVAPGFLIVLHFWPKLFFSLDTWKLFFLATSLSLPVLAANTVAVMSARPFKKQTEDSGLFYTAMLISFMMLYACLLAAWILRLTFGQFVAIIIALEFCGYFISYRAYRRAHKDRARALQQTIPSPDKQPPS